MRAAIAVRLKVTRATLCGLRESQAFSMAARMSSGAMVSCSPSMSTTCGSVGATWRDFTARCSNLAISSDPLRDATSGASSSDVSTPG